MENRFDLAIVKRDRKIIEQRKAGRSYTEIGKPLGMTKYRVQRIVERDAPEYTGHIFRRLREAEFYKDRSLPVIDPARATAAAIPPDITRDVTVARDLARGDLPFKEISTLMGVSVQQLNAWERKYGIRNRREDGLGNPVPFEFDEVLFDLDECGFSYAEISAIVGLYLKAVRERLSGGPRVLSLGETPESYRHQREAVRELAEKGYTKAEVARRLGMRDRAVDKYSTKYGIVFQQDKRYTGWYDKMEKRDNAIVAERRRGRSYAEIAKRHDIRWITARAVIARKSPELLSGPRGREGKSPKGG
jgi:DNA-directed RNA polymerase specialized sigma24 family protein